MVEVSALIDPDYLVEIEVTAIKAAEPTSRRDRMEMFSLKQ
jgi:hypothetical protein